MEILRTLLLFVATALAEILGCYLPYLWIKEGRSSLLLIPGALSLALFVWLLTLHPVASGLVYAAYGGIYVSVAVIWLMIVDKVAPSGYDWAGIVLVLTGSLVIIWGYGR